MAKNFPLWKWFLSCNLISPKPNYSCTMTILNGHLAQRLLAFFQSVYPKFAHFLGHRKLKYFTIFWNPSKFAHFLVTKNQGKIFENFLPSTLKICPLFCHKKWEKSYLSVFCHPYCKFSQDQKEIFHSLLSSEKESFTIFYFTSPYLPC